MRRRHLIDPVTRAGTVGTVTAGVLQGWTDEARRACPNRGDRDLCTCANHHRLEMEGYGPVLGWCRKHCATCDAVTKHYTLTEGWGWTCDKCEPLPLPQSDYGAFELTPTFLVAAPSSRPVGRPDAIGNQDPYHFAAYREPEPQLKAAAHERCRDGFDVREAAPVPHSPELGSQLVRTRDGLRPRCPNHRCRECAEPRTHKTDCRLRVSYFARVTMIDCVARDECYWDFPVERNTASSPVGPSPDLRTPLVAAIRRGLESVLLEDELDVDERAARERLVDELLESVLRTLDGPPAPAAVAQAIPLGEALEAVRDLEGAATVAEVLGRLTPQGRGQ